MIYRLTFESVSAIAHPQAYDFRTERACMRAEDVPEDWWHQTHRDTDSPWDQYNGLKKIQGELIRNVTIHELAEAPVLGKFVQGFD